MTSGGKGSLTGLNNPSSGPIYAALNSFITNSDPNPLGKPKAYLNWILLDEQLKYVNSYPQSGAIVVGAAGAINNLAYTGIPINKSGYLYIWVSNETQNWNVFFDNLRVAHYSGPLLKETHYYPFGLTMAGISSKALKPYYAENRYKFNNGTELASKEFTDGSGLELYETDYRGYDPQIGRFWQLDPLSEATKAWSPYTYAMDNPIFFNGPLGLEGDTAHLEPVIVTGVAPCKTNCTPKPPDVAGSVGTAPSTPSTPLTVVLETPPPGKVIPFRNPAPGVLQSLGLSELGLTAVSVLLPLSTGHEGIPIQNPIFSPYTPDSKKNDDGNITLYRGVDPNNPSFKYALIGDAVPLGMIGGHSDPRLHNDGNTESIFTSWTVRPSVAAKFAGRYRVVLIKRFNISQTVPSPDMHDEQEILVSGIVIGAAVQPAWVTKRL